MPIEKNASKRVITRRDTGTNPSVFGPNRYPGTWNVGREGWSSLHPVEQVSWMTCVEMLDRLGLNLPTEAQWEYAARSGTTTAWWTGMGKESLAGAANLADSFSKTHGGPSGWKYEDWLDDGHTVHATVGSYSGNQFGLHDVIGNVWEWCMDGDGLESYRQGLRKDPLVDPAGASARVARGGAYSDTASFGRSASRGFRTPLNADGTLGLRPARTISP